MFKQGDFLKLIISGEKVMVLNPIPAGSVGFTESGYMIRTTQLIELFVREFEVEAFDVQTIG